jgi:hypothetical protein
MEQRSCGRWLAKSPGDLSFARFRFALRQNQLIGRLDRKTLATFAAKMDTNKKCFIVGLYESTRLPSSFSFSLRRYFSFLFCEHHRVFANAF